MGTKSRSKGKGDPFAHLTWDDLEEWAGSKIVGRGRSYSQRGAVRDLGRTADGAIVAWVHGERRYATKVTMESGRLLSTCTCPYWTDCKHAIAIVLLYLENLKQNVAVPRVKSNDARVAKLASHSDYDEDDLNDEDLNDEEEDDLLAEEVERKPARKRHSRRVPLRRYLEGLTKTQLVTLVEEICQQFHEVSILLAWIRRRSPLSPSHQERS